MGLWCNEQVGLHAKGLHRCKGLGRRGGTKYNGGGRVSDATGQEEQVMVECRTLGTWGRPGSKGL